jgi:hypothetical protein
VDLDRPQATPHLPSRAGRPLTTILLDPGKRLALAILWMKLNSCCSCCSTLRAPRRLRPLRRLGGIRLAAEIVLQPRLFGIRGVRNVDGDFLAEILGNLLQRQARGLGEEEVDHYRRVWVSWRVDVDQRGRQGVFVATQLNLPGMNAADQSMITR